MTSDRRVRSNTCRLTESIALLTKCSTNGCRADQISLTGLVCVFDIDIVDSRIARRHAIMRREMSRLNNDDRVNADTGLVSFD
jgi:hypothetical protein